MRNLIIGVTVVFFILSAYITFQAFSIPVSYSNYQTAPEKTEPQPLSPAVEETLEKFAREQAASRALVEELQATITTLEDKLSAKEEEAGVHAAAEEPPEAPRTLAVIGSGVFLTGKTVNEKNLMSAVSAIVQEISEHPDHQVRVEGHTSNILVKPSSGKQYIDNMELSIFRAGAVAAMLEKMGIARERILVAGYGDTRPVASNETYEGRVLNRRVEVILVPGDKES